MLFPGWYFIVQPLRFRLNYCFSHNIHLLHSVSVYVNQKFTKPFAPFLHFYLYQIVFTSYWGIIESLVTIVRFSTIACEIINLSNDSPWICGKFAIWSRCCGFIAINSILYFKHIPAISSIELRISSLPILDFYRNFPTGILAVNPSIPSRSCNT